MTGDELRDAVHDAEPGCMANLRNDCRAVKVVALEADAALASERRLREAAEADYAALWESSRSSDGVPYREHVDLLVANLNRTIERAKDAEQERDAAREALSEVTVRNGRLRTIARAATHIVFDASQDNADEKNQHWNVTEDVLDELVKALSADKPVAHPAPASAPDLPQGDEPPPPVTVDEMECALEDVQDYSDVQHNLICAYRSGNKKDIEEWEWKLSVCDASDAVADACGGVASRTAPPVARAEVDEFLCWMHDEALGFEERVVEANRLGLLGCGGELVHVAGILRSTTNRVRNQKKGA